MRLEMEEEEKNNTIVIKQFETEDEAVEFLKGYRYKMAIDDMWDNIFRPRHKHGYHDRELNDLLGISWSMEPQEIEKKTFTYEELQEKIHIVVDKLEELYREVLKDNLGE